jgi:ppGpp synthetase/RelA/SpoT-type nucleotidyltranferase
MAQLIDKKQTGEFYALPIEMGIFVPSTKDASVKISDSEFGSRVRQVEDYVAERFGGFSSIEDIEGGYYSSDLNEVIREEVKQVKFFGNVGDFQANIKELLNQITMWCLAWGQEAIGFEVEGDLFYVGANSKIYRDGGVAYAKGGMTLSHVDVSMAPMGERTQVGSEGNTYLGGNAFMYAKGGRIRNWSKDEAYKLVPNNFMESEILDKVRGQINSLEFAGNMYIKGWEGDIYLYNLDDFDENFLKDVGAKIKSDERVYRYLTRNTAFGGMVPLIKINPSRQLVYFNESEDEDVKWTSRGQEFHYLNLVGDKNKFEKGGMVDYSRKMLENQNKEIGHHSDELKSILDKYKKMSVEPWVIAKMERATTDLSDITHFLDGKEGKDYYAKGGNVGKIRGGIKYVEGQELIWDDVMSFDVDTYGEKEAERKAYDYIQSSIKYWGGELNEDDFIVKKSLHGGKNFKGSWVVMRQFPKYAKGGKIKDQYEGRTPEDIWNNLSLSQKQHFIYDHVEEISEYKGIENLPTKEIRKAYNSDWDNLDNDIKNRFSKHTREGQYAKGGGIPTKIVNKGKTYNRNTYKAIYGDFDKDGLMNSDDPNPVKKGDKRRVEQLSFPKIFDSLLDTKGKLDSTMYNAVNKLKKITPDGGKIYARTKTPYSIINKLIDSRMITPKDPKKGLTDMVGTTIVVDNTDQVFAVQKEIENGALGEIVPEGVDKNGKVILADNKYENPKGGYRAIHYIIMMDGIPVEVQLKTKRMKEINELAHPHYKAKNLNSDFMEYLTSLADKGDRGDKKAQAEFNRIMRIKKDVSEKLKMDRTYMYAHGGRVQEIYGDEMELDGIFEDFKD